MQSGHFEDQVRRELEDVLTPRGFTLTSQGDVVEPEPSAVFEADPKDFARRYPALRKLYEAGPPDAPCLDLWVRFDATTGRVRFGLEGHDLAELYRELDQEPPASFPPGRLP